MESVDLVINSKHMSPSSKDEDGRVFRANPQWPTVRAPPELCACRIAPIGQKIRDLVDRLSQSYLNSARYRIGSRKYGRACSRHFIMPSPVNSHSDQQQCYMTNVWLYSRGNNPHTGEEEIPSIECAEKLNGALTKHQSNLTTDQSPKPTETTRSA